MPDSGLPESDTGEWRGDELVHGRASGRALKLDAPLSFWGGLDPETGQIVGRHPSVGAVVTGRVLVMESGRGSSSSPSVLAEALRLGTGPSAIVIAVSGGPDSTALLHLFKSLLPDVTAHAVYVDHNLRPANTWPKSAVMRVK